MTFAVGVTSGALIGWMMKYSSWNIAAAPLAAQDKLLASSFRQ
jgi:hypothetical protein